MKSLWFALALAFAFSLPPLSASAQGAASVAEDDSEVEVATWIKRLDDAKARLDVAKQQLDSYLKAKSSGAARRYPRGDAKEAYIKGIKESAAEYESARLALPERIDEARRAGIEPGVLDPYETAAEDAVPVAELTDYAPAQANPGDDDVQQAEAADDDVDAAENTDTPEEPARNTDTQEEDPGPQTENDDD